MVVLIMWPRAIGCSVVLLGALSCASVPPPAVQEPATTVVADRVVEVVAERFLFTPSEITVEAGTTVEFRLTSQDTDHGFRIVGHNRICGPNRF